MATDQVKFNQFCSLGLFIQKDVLFPQKQKEAQQNNEN